MFFNNFAFLCRSLPDTYTATSNNYLTSSLTVTLNIFPNHMQLTVWVVAQNELGEVKSDELTKDAEYFGM